MKRTFAFILTLMFCVMMLSTSLALVEPNTKITYYVARPEIAFDTGADEIETLSFGEPVTLEDINGAYALVKTQDGRIGLVYKGYLAQSEYPLLWVDKEGFNLACMAGLNDENFGSAICGRASNERAVVATSLGQYIFIITESGLSGYTMNTNPHVTYYVDQVPEE